MHRILDKQCNIHYASIMKWNERLQDIESRTNYKPTKMAELIGVDVDTYYKLRRGMYGTITNRTLVYALHFILVNRLLAKFFKFVRRVRLEDGK